MSTSFFSTIKEFLIRFFLLLSLFSPFVCYGADVSLDCKSLSSIVLTCPPSSTSPPCVYIWDGVAGTIQTNDSLSFQCSGTHTINIYLSASQETRMIKNDISSSLTNTVVMDSSTQSNLGGIFSFFVGGLSAFAMVVAIYRSFA